MKSAYELAMERLAASDPDSAKPLTDEQKNQLADIDTRYQAKIAEREIFLNKQLQDAIAKNAHEDAEQIRVQIRNEKIRLEEEREAEKDNIRNA